MSDLRPVTRVIRAQPASDGAGVRLYRSLGTPALAELDPFLMLDEFRSDDAGDYIAGFPEHPHRGFETVTYMLAGRMRHGDNQGNTGLLGPGSVQWMTAGRGIVHSEMPEQQDGLMWGFQLWINLPSRDKMTAPRYQDIAPDRIPVVAQGGATVKVIAGAVDGVAGPVSGVATSPTYLDVALTPGARFRHALPAEHNAFVYVYDGAARVGATVVEQRHLAVLGAGASVEVAAEGPTRFLLLAGQPLGERVARYGPFVMTTPDEIRQAITDYQAGRF
jgi:quercetin 2,3-dioxygenase